MMGFRETDPPLTHQVGRECTLSGVLVGRPARVVSRRRMMREAAFGRAATAL